MTRGAAAGAHQRYLDLVEQIERRFAVADWRSGEVELWPLARMDLYLDLFRDQGGGGASPSPPPFLWRIATSLATPLTNLWSSRRDLAHRVVRPAPAHAVILGDGVSLDRVDGAWQDRFGEPLIAAFERRGLTTFLMQGGRVNRLPRRRPTFAANVIAVQGALGARLSRTAADLPDHEAVLGFLADQGARAPSLGRVALEHRGRLVASTASAFERVLRTVRPKVAFVVTWYAGLGPAFMLACRRQGILSVDLQHCPQGGSHKAYGWWALPKAGYAVLPAVFWTWTEADATHIRRWTQTLVAPWHGALHGGHTQLAPFLDDGDPRTRAWDAAFDAIGGRAYAREILVALQPSPGHRALWDALAAEIEAAPPDWRWWIRRHPASTAAQGADFGRLLALASPKVVVDAASQLPLPALLRRMSAVVSLASGAAVEAAVLGVPALFLSLEARGLFPDLLARGLARLLEVQNLNDTIADLPAPPTRPLFVHAPDLDETLAQLEALAPGYARLCADRRAAKSGGG